MYYWPSWSLTDYTIAEYFPNRGLKCLTDLLEKDTILWDRVLVSETRFLVIAGCGAVSSSE